MKKYILSIALATLQLTAVAQTVNVHFKNGQTIQYPSDNVDYVDFSVKAPDPTVSAGAVVDLGLSIYWASFNLGAESPEEFGDYYAWGETKPKSSYSKDNYSYYDKEKAQYIDIGEDIASTEYDAATVTLGSEWRMPTKAEMQELIDNCEWEWTQINGINGYKVISKINNNSIFLPAAGLQSESYNLYAKENIQYWTSTIHDEEDAYHINNDIIKQKSLYGKTKWRGLSIRPVTSNPNAEGGPVDHTQDYLVTDKMTASFTGGAYTQINNRIQAGSVLNTKFTNGSSEAVTLVSVQIFESGSSNAGNNVLESEVEVAAGESKAYGLKLGTSMTTPVVRFTYQYNKKKYTAEATWNL